MTPPPKNKSRVDGRDGQSTTSLVFIHPGNITSSINSRVVDSVLDGLTRQEAC